MGTGTFMNNWKGLKNSVLMGAYGNTGATHIKHTGFNDAYGVNGSKCVPYSGHISPLLQLTNSYAPSGTANAVRFGFSDTTPTTADIDLGSPWSSGVTYVNVTNGAYTFDDNTDTVSRTFSVTVQNNAAAAVTIREFGLFCDTYYGASASNQYTPCLLYRGILDTPVTLNQYDSATLTFTISMQLGDPI